MGAPRLIISLYWFNDSCLCNLISSLNFLIKASTRRFNSSWLSDGSFLRKWGFPGPGPGPTDRANASGATWLVRSLNVSDFFTRLPSESTWISRPWFSHVSDFFMCLLNGIALPSVIAFHVFSNVSCRFGFATLNALAPEKSKSK